MNVLLLDPSAMAQYRTFLRLKAEPPAQQVAEPRQASTLTDVTAVLPIQGVIDYRPSILSELGFVASSMQLRAEFRRLVAEPSVRKIVLDIDSPGGLYSGTPEFARDIFAAREVKPVIAVANPMAASGALWLATAASKLFVLGSGDAGSLGALILHEDASEMFTSNGIKHTILRSPEGKADFNALEPLSEESRAHHQAQVDAIASEFLKSVAKFRGVSPQKAAADFGQGRMLSAKQAVDAGLADGMVDSLDSVVGARNRSRTRTKLANAELEEARARREEREAVWADPPLLPIDESAAAE